MKILFACHRFPFPPNRGGKIRPFNMIKHLSQKHELFVASVAHTQKELEEGAGLKEYCAEIYAEVVPERRRWIQALCALPSPMPSSVAYFSSSRLRKRVQQAAQKVSFDAVIVHCAFAAQYALGVSAPFRLMDFGDLDSAKWAEYSRTRVFPLSSGYALEARKLCRYEAALARHFEHCSVTTRGEMEEFYAVGGGVTCTLIPNGVDIRYFSLTGHRKEADPVIVFLGRMDYFPNVDAVTYFVNEIFPIIRRKKPDVRFRIIGSNPVNKIRALAEIDGVSVTGHVPDVRPHLADAMVSVAPLRIARGTQNKVLESMAMGIPVVATSQAAKGIEAVPEKHFLIADDPRGFADKVLSLVGNSELRRGLTEAARQQVEAVHIWPASMAILDSVLAKSVINGWQT